MNIHFFVCFSDFTVPHHRFQPQTFSIAAHPSTSSSSLISTTFNAIQSAFASKDAEISSLFDRLARCRDEQDQFERKLSEVTSKLTEARHQLLTGQNSERQMFFFAY
jgi:septal ring factor EnvC (AmiA/AmiB activator)